MNMKGMNPSDVIIRLGLADPRQIAFALARHPGDARLVTLESPRRASDGAGSEEERVEVLRRGGWLIGPSNAEWLREFLRADDELSMDCWWRWLNDLRRAATLSGWCLVPWGPESFSFSLHAIIELRGTSGTSGPSHRFLAKSGVKFIEISSYGPRGGGAEIFSSAIMVEEKPGSIVADAAFSGGRMPYVGFVSPDGFEFLTDNRDVDSNWLHEDYEVLGASDGSSRQDVPWLYRPKTPGALLEMIRLSFQGKQLTLMSGSQDMAFLNKIHHFAEQHAEQLLPEFVKGAEKTDLLYVTAFGGMDLNASLVAGRQARHILDQLGKGEAPGRQVLLALL